MFAVQPIRAANITRALADQKKRKIPLIDADAQCNLSQVFLTATSSRLVRALFFKPSTPRIVLFSRATSRPPFGGQRCLADAAVFRQTTFASARGSCRERLGRGHHELEAVDCCRRLPNYPAGLLRACGKVRECKWPSHGRPGRKFPTFCASRSMTPTTRTRRRHSPAGRRPSRQM